MGSLWDGYWPARIHTAAVAWQVDHELPLPPIGDTLNVVKTVP